MTKDVAEYSGTCLVCQRRNKMPKKTASLHPVGVPNRAFACTMGYGPSRSIVRCSCLLSNGADNRNI